MIEKSSTAAWVGGSVGATVFGLTPSQWSVVGIIAGIVIGAAGLIANIYFQNRRLQIAMRNNYPED
jgi:hypothetical protein